MSHFNSWITILDTFSEKSWSELFFDSQNHLKSKTDHGASSRSHRGLHGVKIEKKSLGRKTGVKFGHAGFRSEI